MKVLIEKNACIVTKEPTDKIYTETAFFYALRKALIALGHDVIKKNPQKDGHMLSDPYYIRERKWKFCITDPMSAIRLIHTEFNADGEVTMNYHTGEIW